MNGRGNERSGEHQQRVHPEYDDRSPNAGGRKTFSPVGKRFLAVIT